MGTRTYRIIVDLWGTSIRHLDEIKNGFGLIRRGKAIVVSLRWTLHCLRLVAGGGKIILERKNGEVVEAPLPIVRK